MKMHLRSLLFLSLFSPLFAQELEQIQSIVDEVTMLRMRYEACVQKKEALEQQVQTQDKTIEKLISDHALKALSCEAKPKEESSLSALLEENRRLSSDLAKAQEELHLLKKERTQKQSHTGCADENPFQKLLMKEENEALISAEVVRFNKAVNYRLKHESEIYDAPEGKVVALWEEKRSFTSNTASRGWIKITGYFVQRKWRRAAEEMWVKETDAIRQ